MRQTWIAKAYICALLLTASTVFAEQAPAPSMPGRTPIIPTIVNEAYTVRDVRKVRLLLKADLLINQGPRDALFVEGLKTVISQLKVDVTGGVVTIRYKGTPDKNAQDVSYSHPLIFRLTVTNLQGIEATTGTVQSTELRTSVPFAIDFSGDSVGQLAIFSKDFKANVSGFAQVQLRGSANKERVKTRNRGRFLAQEMRAESVDVDVNDDSQAYVHARLVLDGTVQDNGQLFYVGIPQSNQVTLSNLGKMSSILEKPITPPTTPKELPSNPNPHGQGWNSTP
jgi:hypothetical protein